jgi:hypothetical protein
MGDFIDASVQHIREREHEREVHVLVTLSTFGNAEQADKLAVSIARAVHYGVRPGAVCERVLGHFDGYDVTARELIPFDSVLDDGNEPPGYERSVDCKCPVIGKNEAAQIVRSPDCPVHGINENAAIVLGYFDGVPKTPGQIIADAIGAASIDDVGAEVRCCGYELAHGCGPCMLVDGHAGPHECEHTVKMR